MVRVGRRLPDHTFTDQVFHDNGFDSVFVDVGPAAEPVLRRRRRLVPGARAAGAGPQRTSALEPGTACHGSARPPRCCARNSSARPKKSRLFSGRPKPWPSSG